MAQLESGSAELDAEELMHLAIRAMGEKRGADALLLVKQGLAQAPDNGRLRYLLGALYAELGMIERAIQEMTRATQLSPELGTARFQLGLLHLARADVALAQDAWAPLDQLAEDDPLRIFKHGMVKFVDHEYEESIALLNQGIALNADGEALNKSMERVIAQIEAEKAAERGSAQEAREASTQPSQSKPEPQPASAGLEHVLLARYRK